MLSYEECGLCRFSKIRRSLGLSIVLFYAFVEFSQRHSKLLSVGTSLSFLMYPLQLLTFFKLCDVVSKWEQACQQLKTGKFERSKAIKLTYKNRSVVIEVTFKPCEYLLSEVRVLQSERPFAQGLWLKEAFRSGRFCEGREVTLLRSRWRVLGESFWKSTSMSVNLMSEKVNVKKC